MTTTRSSSNAINTGDLVRPVEVIRLETQPSPYLVSKGKVGVGPVVETLYPDQVYKVSALSGEGRARLYDHWCVVPVDHLVVVTAAHRQVNITLSLEDLCTIRRAILSGGDEVMVKARAIVSRESMNPR